MVEVEVRAAHNVLEACAQTDTIEKVVFTSSITAVIWRENRNWMPDLDERNWSEPNFCKKFKVLLTFFKKFNIPSEPIGYGFEFQIGLLLVFHTHNSLQSNVMIAVVACSFEDNGREDSMGFSHGQGSEHGVDQCGSVDGSEPIHNEPVPERSG